ncbi:MAG TPA: transglycosylase domain-containing protein, partial [Micromonospora sp.]
GRDPEALRKAKRRKRINLAIAAFAVFIMLAGIGVVGLTYYSTTVVLPEDIKPPLATTIYYSDGTTQLAKVGEQNRELVTINDIPLHVQRAVASAEDRKFYEHSGIDYAGIARAAWNNFTGGSKQGASTITQQYARNAYDNLQDDTYARKIKEAVFASKLNDKFSKEEIMQHYLNTIYFGRGAYGIQAAAQTYFGKSAKQLTVAEGAVLAGVIKQPVPDPSTGHKGFDPANDPQAALDRWNYVLNGMVEKGWLKQAERPTEYPKNVKAVKEGSCAIDCGINTPVGNVVNYVREEMAQMGICTLTKEPTSDKPTCSAALQNGGYKIKTSIDYKKQKAAEAAAQRAKKGSELADQPKNLMAALVSIDPTNGRVVAYYGGDNGTGTDYAGKNTEQDGRITGGHPPGSSFKVYTLAAALEAGISVDSHWDATPFKPEGTQFTVQNAGRDVKKTCSKWCSLEYSTVQSYNVPFYHVTAKIGPDKVVDMAKAAGVTMMWTTSDDPPKGIDLTKTTGKEVAPEPFFNVVGYGQYPITVLDHANGLATLANRGKYYKAHFVVSVQQQNPDTGKGEKVGGEQLKWQQRIRREVADNVSAVLKQIPPANNDALDGGRPAAGKTGTWELAADSKNNAHAWMTGYTPQLATAVWVGNVGPKQTAIKDKQGNNIGGGTLPAEIWKRYMNAALKGTEVAQFQDTGKIGDPDAGNGESPAPPPPAPRPQPGGSGCPNPFDPRCQTTGPDPNPRTQEPPQDPTQPGLPGGGGGGGLLPSTSPSTRE